MDGQPEFFIIAGPNGAGKSTFGQAFVSKSLTIFNGDLVFADLVRRYPQIEPVRLQGGVAHALEEARDKALLSRSDFAFESNYSSDMASDVSQRFRDAGYKTTLIYFGLDNLKLSAYRVERRVISGGHDVSPETIRYNFDEGIKRINSDLHQFDRVIFVDNRNENARIIGLIQKESQQHLHIEEEIKWYKIHFEHQVNKLVPTPKLVPQIKIRPPKH